jgi:hypothetical protein
MTIRERFRVALLAAAINVAGCAATPERIPQEPAALSRWVNEICALPAAEREAELARLREKTGLVIFCGREEDKEAPDTKPAPQRGLASLRAG